MDSKIGTTYTYKNYKLRNHFSFNKNKLEKVSYTKHVSYWKDKQHKRALNFVDNSMPSYVE